MLDKVRYKVVKSTLEKGDVILTLNIENALSNAIKNVTNSNYSHVIMYIGNGNIIESTMGGTKITPLAHYISPKYNMCVLKPQIDSYERGLVVEESLKLLGKRYGYIQLFYYLFLRLIGKSEDPKWQLDIQPNALVCSEAIALAFEKIGKPVKAKLRPSQIEPVDFIQSPQFVKVTEYPPKII